MKYYKEKEMLKDTLLKEGSYKSIKDVFERVARLMPDANILAELDNKKNIVYHTSLDVLNDIENLGDGLLALGLKDKHIAILSENSYRYLVTDVTIAGGVGVVTPIDKDANINLLKTLLEKSEAEIVICSAHLVDKIKEVMQENKRITQIITIDNKVNGFLSFLDVQDLGRLESNKGKFRQIERKPNELAEIIFTSGTTGSNKAVALTQGNLTANVTNCLETICGSKTHNTSMSILPMHHATEIYTHIIPRVAAGRLTYINGSMKDMMTNIKIFKPYIITVVPMVANAFYKSIWAQAKKQGKEEQLKKGIKLCKLFSKFGIDITHKLFKDLYAPFGGNLIQIVCGGAPLDAEVVKGLRDLGIYIVNGFGITECGPLVSMNTDTVGNTASVGRACPRLEIKLADKGNDGIGELCVKGDSVSKEYYKDQASTALVHDEEGFFHTGDLAYINEKGEIFLAGRKKNLIVLSSGKNVYPEELEHEITSRLKYVQDTMVFEEYCEIKGEREKVICAQIYLSENVEKDKILQDFRALNKEIASYKRISYVEILDSEFEKNASRKIMRKQALARHKEVGGLVV